MSFAINGQTQLAGVIGWPVEHSLSPAMHNAALDALGLNWRFMPAWVLRLQGTTTENRSNLSLYEYKRTEFSLNVRREFK